MAQVTSVQANITKGVVLPARSRTNRGLPGTEIKRLSEHWDCDTIPDMDPPFLTPVGTVT